MKAFKWIDRNLWSVPVLIFLLSELSFWLWSVASGKAVFLAALPVSRRQAIYSSMTGTSSTFFVIAIAVVTILVAFAPRQERIRQAIQAEHRMTKARTIVIGSLIAASFFMLVLGVTATVALGVDYGRWGNSVITTLIEAAGMASVVGLLVGGAGLALVVVERSRTGSAS